MIYAGTFSKVLFPGLRIGYVVAARPLLEKMVLARWNADVGTSLIPQAALAALLERGGLDVDHDDSHAMRYGPDFALLLHGVQPAGSDAGRAARAAGRVLPRPRPGPVVQPVIRGY